MSWLDGLEIITAQDKADEAAEQERNRINSEAEIYLKETDWYVTRFLETGVEVPSEVSINRENARLRIKRGSVI